MMIRALASRRLSAANIGPRLPVGRRAIALTLGVVVASTASAQDNLVVNGSFENPAINRNFVFYPQGSTGITGWTVTAPTSSRGVDIVNSTGYNNPNWAFAGLQSVDLAGSPGRGGIQQSLPTVTGQSYTLSFALSTNGFPSTPVTASVSILWGGTLVDTLTSPAFGTWQTYTYNVVGGVGTSTLLSFVGNTDGSFGTLLDNVVVIPSPSAATLLGLGGLLAARRRRR